MSLFDTYDYKLPKEFIASTPAEPRDGARLFVYNTETDGIRFDYFYNLSAYIPEKSLLVLNTTKVVPARVRLKKENGGMVEILFLINENVGDGVVPCLADRKLSINSVLFFPNGKSIMVRKQIEERFFLELQFPREDLPTLLEQYGMTPIPKYIKGNILHEEVLRERYQTIFADSPFSVAAPTASLHFTERVFVSLAEKHIAHVPVTLHIGLGTFAPVKDKNISEKKLHNEWFEIPEESAKMIREAKEHHHPVIAVGTTVVRALESSARGIRGATDIFIFPPFEFKVPDALITNFHVPKSSLVMLVDAFLKHKGAKRGVLNLYAIAIKEKFRFYSFGDVMLIL